MHLGLKIKLKMEKELFIALFYLFRIFPIEKRKIVFSNFFGKGLGDNPKYILLELLKLGRKYDFVWMLKDDNTDLPENVRKVPYKSIKAVYELATAKVWVDNNRKPAYVRKRSGQYYMQTWHAGIPGKRVEMDSVTPLIPAWVKASKNDSRIADVFISNCRFATSHYQTGFWYTGDIAELGYPRNDILFSEDNVKKLVCERLGIDLHMKLLLYAPTFRSSHKDVYDVPIASVLSALSRRFGGTWVGIVRLHPLMTRDQYRFSEKVIDGTDYPDMYELLRAADVEITDYSSSIFEFSCLQGKPSFIYGKDVDEYRKERGFYYDVCGLPFPFAESKEQLIHNIEHFDEALFSERLKQFNDEIGWFEDGHAAERAAKLLIRKIEGID